MPGFKIKDGDICGKNGVILYKWLYKNEKGQWVGEFICPYDQNHFISTIDAISSGDRKSCGCQIKVARNKFGALHHKDLLL